MRRRPAQRLTYSLRELFYYENIKVCGAESVPFLGPHVLDHKGVLTFHNENPSGCFARIVAGLSRRAPRKKYLVRLVGDSMYYYDMKEGNGAEDEVYEDEQNSFVGTISLSKLISVESERIMISHRSRDVSAPIVITFGFRITCGDVAGAQPQRDHPAASAGSRGYYPSDRASHARRTGSLPDDFDISGGTGTWLLSAPTEASRAEWIQHLRNLRAGGTTHIEGWDTFVAVGF